MKYWFTDRNKFLRANPYRGPHWSKEEAQAWTDKINAVHKDIFRVIEVPEGWDVEQDVRPAVLT